MRFKIRILDPDSRQIVHELNHTVWADSNPAAVSDVCRSYDFQRGAWIVQARSIMDRPSPATPNALAGK